MRRYAVILLLFATVYGKSPGSRCSLYNECWQCTQDPCSRRANAKHKCVWCHSDSGAYCMSDTQQGICTSDGSHRIVNAPQNCKFSVLMPTADDSGSCTVTTGTSTYIIETPLLFGVQEKPTRGKFSARISLCDNVRRQPVPTHCGNHGTIQVFESRGKGDGQCWIFRQSNTNQQLGHVQPTEYADQISIPMGKTYCCSGTDKPWPELIDIKLKMHKSCESKGSTVHTIRPTTDYSVLHRCTSEDELVFEADVCYTYTTQNITAISSASDSKGLSLEQIIGISVGGGLGILVVVVVVVVVVVRRKSSISNPTDRAERSYDPKNTEIRTPLLTDKTSTTSRSVPAEGDRDSSVTYSSDSDTRNAAHRQQAEDESSNEDVADNSQANAASISERAEGDRDSSAIDSSDSDTRNAVYRQQAEDESSNEDVADNFQANAASISKRAEGDRDRSATHSSDSDDSNTSSDNVRRQAEDDFYQSPKESNGEESGLDLSDDSQNSELGVLPVNTRGELQSSQDQGGHNNA